MSDSHNDEKIGKAIVNIRWFVFAVKFIAAVTLIALVILLILGKCLWIAPLIGICVYMAYRLMWRLVRRLIGWVASQ